MKTKKYTPGPWHVDSIDHGPDGREIFVSAKYDVVCGGPWHMSVEDARLISAAPELLEALRLVMVSFEINGSADPNAVTLIDQIKSAISKAEGGSENGR